MIIEITLGKPNKQAKKKIEIILKALKLTIKDTKLNLDNDLRTSITITF